MSDERQPIHPRVEVLARQMCKLKGEDPDKLIVSAGLLGGRYPQWQFYERQAMDALFIDDALRLARGERRWTAGYTLPEDEPDTLTSRRAEYTPVGAA